MKFESICEVKNENVNSMSEIVVKVKVIPNDKSISFLDINDNVILNISINEIFPKCTDEFLKSFISILKKYKYI